GVELSFFCFSSRRRHTRSKRDWSSDVCSSDLRRNLTGLQEGRVSGLQNLPRLKRRVQLNRVGRVHERLASHGGRASARVRIDAEIGRASCRESEEESQADGYMKRKRTTHRNTD